MTCTYEIQKSILPGEVFLILGSNFHLDKDLNFKVLFLLQGPNATYMLIPSFYGCSLSHVSLAFVC